MVVNMVIPDIHTTHKGAFRSFHVEHNVKVVADQIAPSVIAQELKRLLGLQVHEQVADMRIALGARLYLT
jgi:hypothetical protein